ncbi:hypothetical protein P8452_46431 [Trifolium repens]|nr:hypothetical protein P8452_46431 [Trifolium repens]
MSEKLCEEIDLGPDSDDTRLVLISQPMVFDNNAEEPKAQQIQIKMTNDGNLPTSATSERTVSSFYPSPAVSNSAMLPPQTKKRSESWNHFISV